MVKLTGVVFILFLLGFTSSFGQVVYQETVWYDLDSLESVLPNQQGTEKINTLYRIAATLCFEDFEESLIYANEALELSEKTGYKAGIAAATRFKGHAYYYNGEYPKALDLLWKSMNMYEELEDDYHVARLVLEIGTVNLAALNNEVARELFGKAMQRLGKTKEDGSQVGSVSDTLLLYSVIGRTLRVTGKLDSALSVYKTYVDIGRKNNLELTNLMVHVGFISICYSYLGQYDSALYYYRQALNYPEVNPSIKILKHEYKRRMASLYLTIGKIDTAMNFLTDAYEFLSKKGYLMPSQLASLQLGELYLSLKDIPKANFYFQRSEELMEEQLKKGSFYRFDSLKYTVSFGWEVMAPLSKKFITEFIYNNAVNFYQKMYRYHKKNNNKEAYFYFIEKYVKTKDTLNKIERRREIVEVQTKYETERKEEEIISLSQENELNEYRIKQSRIIQFGLVGVLFLGLAFVVLFIRQNRLKVEQEKTSLQQKLFRTQMNPHFIFNSLSSIQHLVMNEESEKASIFLAMFSTLVRNVLNSSVNNTISLNDEIKTIESYLALQKIRYTDKFDFVVDVDPRIDTESLTIPPMLAQPFIENSIEHGMKHKKETGHIDIRFRLAGDLIIFEVEDDGIGRKKAGEIKSKQILNHQSMATSITRDRLKVLNKKLKKKIELRIIDLKNESGEASGTKVVMKIPFEVI
ncbi:MAG: hypothetical protein B6I19_09050 [Bacteroidetes bacterium 4572_114]|nr:MAG: hypothetical protein B6I19_09050 [Bacteroidetes bacterium 4572_114]